MWTGDWTCGSSSRCCSWCVCRRAMCMLDCEVNQVRPAFRHDVLALTMILICPLDTALSVDFRGWDSPMELDQGYSFRGL